MPTGWPMPTEPAVVNVPRGRGCRVWRSSHYCQRSSSITVPAQRIQRTRILPKMWACWRCRVGFGCCYRPLRRLRLLLPSASARARTWMNCPWDRPWFMLLIRRLRLLSRATYLRKRLAKAGEIPAREGLKSWEETGSIARDGEKQI